MSAAAVSTTNPLEALRLWLYDKVEAVDGSSAAASDGVQNKNPSIDKLIALVEEKSGVKREHLAYGVLGVVVITLLINSIQQIVCNIIGFAYPAYASVKAVRSPNKEDDTQWLIYWIVFALFSLVDLSVFTNIPIYWVVKVAFLLYLYLPQTRGALYCYQHLAEPLILQLEKVAEEKMKKN